MAKSSLGKAVSRVGSSGGGKTYTKARPAMYYGVLTLIVVVGLASVVYSRYERTHPYVAVFPAQGSHGYFVVAIDSCGDETSTIPTGDVEGTDYIVLPDNVVRLHPTESSDSGSNATVQNFMSAEGALILTSKKLVYPVVVTTHEINATYTAGEVCPKGSKYAGQKGYPEIAYWTTLSQPKPSLSNDPAAIVVGKKMLVTLAFVPKGVTPAAPTSAQISSLYNDAANDTTSVTTTTTTTPLSTTTSTTSAPKS